MKQLTRPYDQLITAERFSPSTVSDRTIEEHADSDRGRVLFCAPFRRLQNKAQVFSLEANASVRSRLTHCVEVSSIGRYIAQQVIQLFSAKSDQLNKLGLEDKQRTFITLVETACLLHDIGNPPFGHFGELAIQDWFRRKDEDFQKLGVFSGLGEALRNLWRDYYRDFLEFDGNPQGFRIVTRLQPKMAHDKYGLNLTKTLLAAIVKYPWPTNQVNNKEKKKGGYFQTEVELINDVWRQFGLQDSQRHPLVYMMEAADDIAYCLSDLEDGLEKNLIDKREFATFVIKRLENAGLRSAAELRKVFEHLNELLDETAPNNHDPLWNFRSAVIRVLVARAAKNYVTDHKRVLSGTAKELLRRNQLEQELLRALKDFANQCLYSSRVVRSREITAYQVISGLLDCHERLLKGSKERFNLALSGQSLDHQNSRITVESSLLSRFPKKHLYAYQLGVQALQTSESESEGAIREWMLRAHLLVDYMSGMTDEYALQSYQLVSGMTTNIH